MRDLAANIATVPALVPAVKSSASETGSALDLQGFESAALVVNTGAIAGDGDFSIKLQESDTTTAGDFADIDPAHLVGEFPETLEASSTYRQGYIGHKRYLRAVLTRDSGTSIALSAVLVKGHPHDRPA